MGDTHCDKRLPLHRLVVIFIFIVPFVIQGNIISLRGVKLCKIACNRVKQFPGSLNRDMISVSISYQGLNTAENV